MYQWTVVFTETQQAEEITVSTCPGAEGKNQALFQVIAVIYLC